MDTRQVIARFEAERQALALMDHPNIAQVLDAGADGRPAGPTSSWSWSRASPSPTSATRTSSRRASGWSCSSRVCQAVQHAHQKGIIHRDIKPSNVLVTLHDGTPVVKVIDFGVAKAIGQQLTDKTLYTRFAQMIGTPLYMSPEQAEMSGLDVDTRSDVYALGVLLYELLTGTTPFDRQALAEGGVRRDPPDHPRGGAAEAEHAAEHAGRGAVGRCRRGGRRSRRSCRRWCKASWTGS